LKSPPLRPASYEAKATSFVVRIRDGEIQTAVERQGHGFQRSLLIAALKLLADRGSSSSDPSVVCLAVEEPELFQHPTQCRAFASVLRKIATDQGSGIQVTYATHSPYFILPREFSQVRRVVRTMTSPSNVHGVDVYRATEDRVCKRLEGFVAEQTVRRRFDSVCVSELGEALFAEAVLVVEGPSDRGVIEGAAERTTPLSVSGVAVAACGGRDSVLIPASILTELRIPIHVLIDADAGIADRMIGKPQNEIDDAVLNVTASNRKVLRFFGEPEVDWPEQWSSGKISFFPDTLETFLQSKWSACESTRNDLIQDERGFRDKNSATYALAALETPDDPPSELSALIAFVRELPTPPQDEPVASDDSGG
jgi:putative ATP-dependent endonuclease of OLD family